MSTEKCGNEGIVVDGRSLNYQKNKNIDVRFHGLWPRILTRMGQIERMSCENLGLGIPTGNGGFREIGHWRFWVQSPGLEV